MAYVINSDLLENERTFHDVKSKMEELLCKNLNLVRVTCPLFVEIESGLNDDLTGDERAVAFDTGPSKLKCAVVQSLAKWKRVYLSKLYPKLKGGQYKSQVSNIDNLSDTIGIVTNMFAIRKDEELSPLHSHFVDQYDWERIVSSEQRNEDFLKMIVKKIYGTLLEMEDYVHKKYNVPKCLPKDITFITMEEIMKMYPEAKDRKERETLAARKYKAYFLMKIGYPPPLEIQLQGKVEDHIEKRAPDYDDWDLNGDLILYYDEMDIAYELSSMGIRVTELSLKKQFEYSKKSEADFKHFHQGILNEEYPYTIGGGIGKSRLVMFLLKKMHIGEVQCSVWPKGAHHNLL